MFRSSSDNPQGVYIKKLILNIYSLSNKFKISVLKIYGYPKVRGRYMCSVVPYNVDITTL